MHREISMTLDPNSFLDDVYSLYETFDIAMQKFNINLWPQKEIWFRMHSAISTLVRVRKRSQRDSITTKEERHQHYVATDGDFYSRDCLKRLLDEIHFHIKILLRIERNCLQFYSFNEHLDLKVCLRDLCKRMFGAIAFQQFLKK